MHLKSITLSSYSVSLLDDLCEKGHLVTVQDEEHGLVGESYSRFGQQRFSEETIARAANVFAWGDYDAKWLSDHHHAYSDRIVPTGSPRVDFWRREFRAYYEKDDSAIATEPKPYILVVSNFGGPLNENRFWNVIAGARKGSYYERDPQSEYVAYDRVAYLYRLLGQFVLMIRVLAMAFPDVTILVRPHPIESVDGWAKLIGEYANIMVAREGTISSWIRGAAVVIHNGCTSGLEAAVCGVSRIAYRPIPSEYEGDVPNRVSYQAFSLEQLQEMVALVLNGKKVPGSESVDSAAKEILEHRFANLNGELASDRIVKEWEAIAGPSDAERISMNRLLLEGLKSRLRSGAAGAKKSLLSLRSGPHNQEFVTAHKFPCLEESEMRGLQEGLQRTLDRFHDVRIRRFGRRSFLLDSR